MRRKYGSREPLEDSPSFSERIVMAILAPLFFNVSLLICLASLSRRARFIAKAGVYEVLASGWVLFALLIVVPAITGYRLGADKCATVLGHFFFTNMEHEKSPVKTFFAWGCFLLIAYVVSKFLPHA